jgi:hypothetical protein
MYRDPEGFGIYEDYQTIRSWAEKEEVWLPELREKVVV